MKKKFIKKILICFVITVTFCILITNKSNANNIFNYDFFNKSKDNIIKSGLITYGTTENANKELKAEVTTIDKTKPIINKVIKSKSSGDLYGEGYQDIHISSVTGREFKEYRQNIDGWESKYPITHLSGVWSSGWRSECGSVSIITLGSGYSENATFADLTSKMESTNGNTQINGWIQSYTGQTPNWIYNYSRDYIANKLSSGAIGILHSTSSLVSSSGTHYMTLLDISEDKSKVYLSNPWMGSNYQGWITFEQLSYIFESIGFVENLGEKPNYCSSELNVDNIKEDKIFYIGDSWMSILQNYEIAQSSSSYFYAKGGANADWVLNTYSSMQIPSDASCIVVEFGLNGLTNWAKTQELANKLANDYPNKKIYILQTPHICSGYTVDTSFNSKVDTYNEKMKQFCSDKDRIIFINPTTNIVSDDGQGYLKNEYAMNPNDTSMGGGKIHLNKNGNRVWYEDIINCIDSIKVNDEDVTLTIDATDNESGLANEAYSFDGGKTWQSEASKEFTGEVDTVLIRVRDNAGNIGEYGNILRTDVVRLLEIRIKKAPDKTEYTEGENFNTSGMKIEAVYSNGETEEITNYTVTNGSNLKSNQETVTISYTKDGVTKTVKQEITVNKNDSLNVTIRTYEEVTENEKKYIESIMPNTSIEEFKRNIETNGVIEIYKGETKITDYSELISTGMKIKVALGDQQVIYIAVVTGDLQGDGVFDNIDLLKLARYNAKIDLNLKNEYLKASDVYKDNNYADIKDILKMSRVLVGLEEL